jgi:hypothetical protein
MSTRPTFPIPSDLRQLQQRFARWRQTRRPGSPIPEPLWTAATTMARQHGLFRTTQILRLDYNALKKKLQAAAPASPPPTFVELYPCPPARPPQGVLECEGPRGTKLRLPLAAFTPADLRDLIRALWTES